MSKSKSLQDLYVKHYERLGYKNLSARIEESLDLDSNPEIESAKTRTVIVYEDEEE